MLCAMYKNAERAKLTFNFYFETLKGGSLLGHGWQKIQSQRLLNWPVFQ